jgi:hypothetical protein
VERNHSVAEPVADGGQDSGFVVDEDIALGRTPGKAADG